MPDPTRIVRMASAFYQSCVLFATTDLGIHGHLAANPGSAAPAVAEALGLAPRQTALLLDAAAALELLRKEGTGYRNSEEAEQFLVPGAPGDLSDAIRYNRDVYGAWGRLPELLRSGQPVESPALHLGDDPERTRTFVLAMHRRALAIGRAVVPHIDLTGCRQVLDAAGGPGTYSVLLAQQHPDASFTVLDLPGVVAVAEELIAEQQMKDHVLTHAGDYHRAVFPPGQDAVLFFGCLHQESPEAIGALLGKAYDALNPGGKVYIMDMMTDASHTQPAFSALFALNMALTTDDGWVFSDLELRRWLEAAGFHGFAVQALPPPLPHWLASAHKPG